ncbi:hypothetical protein WMY93_009706 [Mugilogobius chulae]|uniref:Uncharacterized protein n=1 Tax=Mugilogobius chulae TaxID=88201 RepID=A0AAW0PC96_9GOBI
MEQTSEEAPLATSSLAGSEQVLIQPNGAPGGSNARALKIAGITALVCLLVSAQVFTAYMVFDQKEQIQGLQATNRRMQNQMSQRSRMPAQKMVMPMGSMALLDFSEDGTKPIPTTPKPAPKVQLKKVPPSVEEQLQAFMTDFEFPHFNKSFLDNLETLKEQFNETTWSLQSWLRYWLIFHMAQSAPAPHQASKTKCQSEAAAGLTGMMGTYRPQCDEQGNYSVCSVGTLLDSAGAWTKTALPSTAPTPKATPTVTNDLWQNLTDFCVCLDLSSSRTKSDTLMTLGKWDELMEQVSEDAPLATEGRVGSDQALVEPTDPEGCLVRSMIGGSNARALKIAGITALVCLLVSAQVFTAYLVFDQKQQIQGLQATNQRMQNQMSRRSQQPPATMPKPPKPEPPKKDLAPPTVEKQLQEFIKEKLPQMNEGFLNNLQTLKQKVDESDWKSFESWMRYWLIFKMAQKTPTPTPPPPGADNY